MQWTILFPSDNVQIHLGAGTASLHITHLLSSDFHNIVNDLLHGTADPVTVSFDVRWSGVRDRVNIRDERNGFTARFLRNTATIEWSAATTAAETGFTFQSDPAQTSTSLFAEIGHERNGIFFK